jgi:hypothetical protein
MISTVLLLSMYEPMNVIENPKSSAYTMLREPFRRKNVVKRQTNKDNCSPVHNLDEKDFHKYTKDKSEKYKGSTKKQVKAVKI